MKTKFTTGVLFIQSMFFLLNVSAQSEFLDINNIKARINADGTLFNNYNTGGAGYNQYFEAPKGSGKHTIFAGNLWIGGIDGSQLKLAAQTYKQSGSDFWPGPLDTISASIDSATSVSWNKVWKVNKSTVDSCLLGSFGSSLPQNIFTWPGNGSAVKNNAKNLAPFYDKNNNGTYEPLNGDCPCIKGDQAVYFIFNDKKIHTESGGTAIGVEIHGMAYAFNKPSDTALNSTVFINYKIINRSSFALNDVYIGNWTDFDIGGANDDYVGSDVTRGAYYGYNGDNYDADYNGAKGYYDTLAAQAVVFLQGPYVNIAGADLPKSVTNPASASGRGYGDGIGGNEQSGLSGFAYYDNSSAVTGNPAVADDYYDYMSGFWKDGTSFTYGGRAKGGSQSCNFMFPGNSDPLGYGTGGNITAATWTESITYDGSSPATPGDRRGLGSYGPFSLSPGAVNCISFAYVFAQGPVNGTGAQSVAKLQTAIDSVRSFYNANELGDCGCSAAIPTGMGKSNAGKDELQASLYPNPANDRLYVKLSSMKVQTARAQVFDVTGKLIREDNLISSINFIDLKDIPAGLYIISISDGENSIRHKFLKN